MSIISIARPVEEELFNINESFIENVKRYTANAGYLLSLTKTIGFSTSKDEEEFIEKAIIDFIVKDSKDDVAYFYLVDEFNIPSNKKRRYSPKGKCDDENIKNFVNRFMRMRREIYKQTDCWIYSTRNKNVYFSKLFFHLTILYSVLYASIAAKIYSLPIFIDIENGLRSSFDEFIEIYCYGELRKVEKVEKIETKEEKQRREIFSQIKPGDNNFMLPGKYTWKHRKYEEYPIFFDNELKRYIKKNLRNNDYEGVEINCREALNRANVYVAAIKNQVCFYDEELIDIIFEMYNDDYDYEQVVAEIIEYVSSHPTKFHNGMSNDELPSTFDGDEDDVYGDDDDKEADDEEDEE